MQLNRDGFVYVIGTDVGLIKIGASHDPRRRAQNFVGLPFTTRLLHTIATNNMAWAERKLHRQFANQRVRGEWFRLGEDELASLLAVARMDKTERDSENMRLSRVMGIGAPPRATSCPFGYKATLQSKKGGCEVITPTLPCRRWTCHVCVKRLRFARAVHYGKMVLKHGSPIHVVQCPPEGWVAVWNRLSRVKAEYLRIEPGDVAGTVFATEELPGCTVLSPMEALPVIGGCIRAIGKFPRTDGRSRPITSSRGWALPQPPQDGDWCRAGRVP